MNFSYSTIADVLAMAEQNPEEKEALLKFAQDLEQAGIAYYNDTEYVYRNSNYGLEIVSMEDFNSEKE